MSIRERDAAAHIQMTGGVINADAMAWTDRRTLLAALDALAVAAQEMTDAREAWIAVLDEPDETDDLRERMDRSWDALRAALAAAKEATD